MNEIDEKIDEVITMIKSIRIEIGDKNVVNTFEKTILNAQIPKLSYWFAVNIKGADIAAHRNVIINSGMHNYKKPELLIKEQGHKHSPIVIEDDVWIGANTVIMKGVTLGMGCVVGANSFVNKSIEPYMVVAGCPARVIARRQ